MATEKQRKNINNLLKMNRAKATFRTEDEFCAAFEAYLDGVDQEEWKYPPSYTSFARKIDCSATSVYHFLSLHPEAEKTASKMLADCMVAGAMNGRYKESTTIFALKNRCGWSDKRETASITKKSPDIATADEARQNVRRIMNSLGFDDRGRPREKSHAKQNLEAVQDRIVKLAEAKA